MLNRTMLSWNRTSKTICVLTAIAAYFALAEWSKATYVDYTPKGKSVIRLYRPFEKFGEATLAVIARGSLEEIADSPDDNRRSPVLIYENGRLLGPGHSSHIDIAYVGEGRYSHWRGQGYLFSASDNTDPNTNGRSYWAGVPY